MKRNDFFIKAFCFAVTLSVAVFSQSPLTDATKTYDYKDESFKLGLYEGSNEIPSEHLAKGYEIAREMREMPKINIVPIGHSVPTGIFNGWGWSGAQSTFKLAANTDMKSACGPAIMAWNWLSTIRSGGKLAGLNNSDVHVIVVQLTWAPFGGPDNYEKNTKLSQKIDSMSHDLGRLAKDAKKNYPNLKMILMQADPWQNNHEPYHAHHEWFFSRQVVMDQINKAADYTGPGVDEVWLGMGGYFWKANDQGSYYTDCCHISGTGKPHFQEMWIKGLLDYNPVVAHWLLKEPPEIPVAVKNVAVLHSPLQKFQCRAGNNGAVVSFTLLDAASISMGLFSIDGRSVVPMAGRDCQAGLNSISLTTGNKLVPGAYIVRLNDVSGSRSIPLAVTY